MPGKFRLAGYILLLPRGACYSFLPNGHIPFKVAQHTIQPNWVYLSMKPHAGCPGVKYAVNLRTLPEGKGCLLLITVSFIGSGHAFEVNKLMYTF